MRPGYRIWFCLALYNLDCCLQFFSWYGFIPFNFQYVLGSRTCSQRGTIGCSVTEISHLVAFVNLVPSIQNSFVANFESSAKREIAAAFFRGSPPAFSRSTPLAFSGDAPPACFLSCFFSISSLYSLQSFHFPVIVPLHDAISHWRTFVEFILEDAFPHRSAQTKIFGSLQKDVAVISRFSPKHRLALIRFCKNVKCFEKRYCDLWILLHSNAEND